MTVSDSRAADMSADGFGLEQSDRRLGQSVIVGINNTAD